jgi:hypothetical protein
MGGGGGCCCPLRLEGFLVGFFRCAVTVVVVVGVVVCWLAAPLLFGNDEDTLSADSFVFGTRNVGERENVTKLDDNYFPSLSVSYTASSRWRAMAMDGSFCLFLLQFWEERWTDMCMTHQNKNRAHPSQFLMRHAKSNYASKEAVLPLHLINNIDIMQ